MTVNDPDLPDPVDDPRSTQADPDELAGGAAGVDDEQSSRGGLPTVGGIPDTGGRDPEPDVNTGAPFTEVPPPS